MKREQLIRNKGYNVTTIQNELFRQITDYLNEKGITRTQFAKEIGVSKGYISQVLNGNFDFKLSKLVELSLAIEKVPEIDFKKIDEVLNENIQNQSSQWLADAEYFDQNEEWLNKSAMIALKILKSLKEQSITQKELAQKLSVSPQYVNRIVKGEENLTLETICKIEKALNITLIEVPSFQVELQVSQDLMSKIQPVTTISQKQGESYLETFDYEMIRNSISMSGEECYEEEKAA